MQVPGWLILIVILALIGFLAFIGIRKLIRMSAEGAEAMRRQVAEYEAGLSALGFTPVIDDYGLANAAFPELRQAISRRLQRLLGGKVEGMPVRIIELWYKLPSTYRDQEGTEQAYEEPDTTEVTHEGWYLGALTPLPAHCPALGVRPIILPTQKEAYDSSYGHRVRTESNDFDERFYVSCADERFARAVLDPALMGWLMERGAAHRAKADWEGMALVAFDIIDYYLAVQYQQSAARLNDALEVLMAIRKRIPAESFALAQGRV